MVRHTRLALLGLLALGLLAGLGQDHSPRAARDTCWPRRLCSAPTAPTNLAVVAVAPTSITISWSPSTSRRASITGYHVSVNGAQVGRATTTQYTAEGLTCGLTYALAVVAVDSRGMTSAPAEANVATSPCPAAPPPPSSPPPPSPSSPPPPPPPPPPPTSGVWQPAPHTTWQWQITGRVDETVPAQMFDIDLFDARSGEINAGVIGRLHAQGVVVICYMDSGAWESYRPDASAFPASVIGNSTGWSGERWLDIRPQSWPLIEPIIVDRMKLAVSLGCDGIEPDQNNPVGNDPGFPITYADEKAWYLEVAKDAHALGLSVGMKNGIEIIDSDLVGAFDWALNEECFQYKECGALKQFVAAGKAVFQVEYQGDPQSFCPTATSLGFSSMKKRLELDAWRVTCW